MLAKFKILTFKMLYGITVMLVITKRTKNNFILYTVI